MRRLLDDQGGFSLPELLTTTWIAVVVSLATFSLIEFVMKRSGEIERRVDATQRSRLAMDTITRQLRSQVCLSATVPPIEDGTADKVTFYADLTESVPGNAPQRRVLTYDPAKKSIVEEAFVGSGTVPNITYPAAPATTRTIATNVVRTGSTPIFEYYKFGTTTPPLADVPLAVPLKANNDGQKVVAQIRVSFTTMPSGANTPDTKAVALTDDVYVRVADPEDPAPIPTCT